MSKILIVAEHAEGKLNAGVAKVVAAAAKIGGDIHVAVLAAYAALAFHIALALTRRRLLT